jgi:hypothetical protein
VLATEDVATPALDAHDTHLAFALPASAFGVVWNLFCFVLFCFLFLFYKFLSFKLLFGFWILDFGFKKKVVQTASCWPA